MQRDMQKDSIRITFKSVSVTADTNTYNICDATGVFFQTHIRETERGTDSAYTGTPPTAAAIVDEWETQSQADPTGFHVNVKEVDGTAQTANDIGADVDAILADTNELQTDDVPGLIAALNDPSAATIADAVWDESTTGHTTSGTFGEQVKTDVDAILADTNELQGDLTNGGRLDLILDELTTQGDTNEGKIDTLDTVADGIKAVTDNLPNSGALTTIGNNVAAILVDTGTDGVVISTATAQAIADEILKRGVSNVEATADAHSLTAIVLAALESSLSGTTWTIKQTDGSTTFTTKTVTVDSNADPITGVT